MNDLKILDLHYINHHYPNHETNAEAMDGRYFDLFGKLSSDREWQERIENIAIGEYTDIHDKKKHLRTETLIEHLRLPEYIQEKLIVLRSDAVRKRIERKINAEREEALKQDKIKVQSMDIRHQLEIYAKKDSSRIKDIDGYVNIWTAIQHSGGDVSKHTAIMTSFKKLAGNSINKSILRKKIVFLQKRGFLQGRGLV
ncbi:MAG: hypothetical protein ACXW09_15325 [Methylococcaceae bacterium]